MYCGGSVLFLGENASLEYVTSYTNPCNETAMNVIGSKNGDNTSLRGAMKARQKALPISSICGLVIIRHPPIEDDHSSQTKNANNHTTATSNKQQTPVLTCCAPTVQLELLYHPEIHSYVDPGSILCFSATCGLVCLSRVDASLSRNIEPVVDLSLLSR